MCVCLCVCVCVCVCVCRCVAYLVVMQEIKDFFRISCGVGVDYPHFQILRVVGVTVIFLEHLHMSSERESVSKTPVLWECCVMLSHTQLISTHLHVRAVHIHTHAKNTHAHTHT
jgi:hypothetical protein